MRPYVFFCRIVHSLWCLTNWPAGCRVTHVLELCMFERHFTFLSCGIQIETPSHESFWSKSSIPQVLLYLICVSLSQGPLFPGHSCFCVLALGRSGTISSPRLSGNCSYYRYYSPFLPSCSKFFCEVYGFYLSLSSTVSCFFFKK